MSLDFYADALATADRRARPRGAPKAKRLTPPAPRAWAAPQPDRNRHILALWTQDRSSYADIGQLLGCSRNAVAGVIDRARRAGLLPEPDAEAAP